MMILMMTMMDLTKRRRDVRRKRSVVRRKRAIVERMTLTTTIIERTNTQEVATMAEEMSMAKIMVKAITRIDERNMVVANNSMEVSSSMEVSNTRTNHPMVGVKNNMGMVDNKNTTSTEVSVVKSMVTEEDDAIVPNLVTETSIETSIAPVGIERLLFRL